jgi:hypothetical protein
MTTLAELKSQYMRAAIMWKNMRKEALAAKEAGNMEKHDACMSASNVYAKQYTLLKTEAVRTFPEHYPANNQLVIAESAEIQKVEQ